MQIDLLIIIPFTQSLVNIASVAACVVIVFEAVAVLKNIGSSKKSVQDVEDEISETIFLTEHDSFIYGTVPYNSAAELFYKIGFEIYNAYEINLTEILLLRYNVLKLILQIYSWF